MDIYHARDEHKALSWKERWQRRLLARGDDAIMLAVYAVVFSVAAMFLTTLPPHYPITRTIAAMVILVAILFISLAWDYLWGAFPIQTMGQWACLVVVGFLSFAFGLVGQINLTPYLLFMNTAQAVITVRMRRGLMYSLILYAVWLGLISFNYGLTFSQAMIVNVATALGMVFSFSVATLVVRFGEQTQRAEVLVCELQQANTELATARVRERELVVTQERIRMAREIHDGIGHHLTALAVQLQAAGALIERDPKRAAAIIATCNAVADQAMDEVRNSVAVMRQTPLDGRSLEEALNALVADFNQHSAVKATLACSLTPRELPAAVAITLYRAAQEGLTNCRKHAVAATRAKVTLKITPDVASVSVCNDGQTSTDITDSHGFGLAGLRERADQLAGVLLTSPGPGGGFELVLSVPIREQSDD